MGWHCAGMGPNVFPSAQPRLSSLEHLLRPSPRLSPKLFAWAFEAQLPWDDGLCSRRTSGCLRASAGRFPWPELVWNSSSGSVRTIVCCGQNAPGGAWSSAPCAAGREGLSPALSVSTRSQPGPAGPSWRRCLGHWFHLQERRREGGSDSYPMFSRGRNRAFV